MHRRLMWTGALTVVIVGDCMVRFQGRADEVFADIMMAVGRNADGRQSSSNSRYQEEMLARAIINREFLLGVGDTMEDRVLDGY